MRRGLNEIVLDTNVLVSALFWNGNERKLLLACLEGEHALVTSPPLLTEAARVLAGKFSYPEADTESFVGMVSRNADVVVPRKPLVVIAADPSDDRVLECAVEGRADIIATGDRHLLALGTFRSIPIYRPAEALRKLKD